MHIVKTQTDKLIVGTNDVSYTAPDTSPTGTAVLNGPVYVGKPSASPGYDAVLNVGTQPAEQQSINRQPPMSTPLGIKLDGSMEIVGDGRVPNALKISGGQTDKLFVDGDAFFSGAVDCGNKGKLASRFAAADASPKPFDLVHEDSITVQLQPIGTNQNLVIQEFNNEFIVIAEDSTNTDLITDLSTIDCFYHVYGERKDINPLIVEYEGNSWEDYPDPNYDPNKVDSDKKNTKDPLFDGPPNTFTK